MIDRHIGDLAELYALGALDESERGEVDRHLLHCAGCATLLAAAENDVALIASSEPQRPAPPELQGRIDRIALAPTSASRPSPASRAWAFPATLAAALVVGLLPSVYFWIENREMHGEMLAQRAAMERIVTSPHRTTPFTAMPGGSAAQVSYAPDGSWYVVVVSSISRSLDVVWMHDGKKTMLGRAAPRGNVAMLYLPKSHRMDKLALMDGDRIVAQAALSWQRTAPGRRAARSA